MGSDQSRTARESAVSDRTGECGIRDLHVGVDGQAERRGAVAWRSSQSGTGTGGIVWGAVLESRAAVCLSELRRLRMGNHHGAAAGCLVTSRECRTATAG